MKRIFAVSALALCAMLGATAIALAQESPAPATPAPEASPTLTDIQYDGRTHVMVAPYIWGPTVTGDFQYSIPITASHPPHGVTQTSVSVKPAEYAASLNSAAMIFFDARKGPFDIFGDYIYTNASASASASATVSGRFGRIQIPVSLATTSHLRASIWEAAAGYSVAHGHNADLSLFAGMREYPIDVTLDYTATVGKRGIISRTGSASIAAITQDVIFGLRGRAYLGDGRWYVPYYIDLGTGIGSVNNQTWEGYGGFGYAFPHGQTLVIAYRDLTYTGFAPISPVQKLTMAGPLLGYTFNL